ncbi:hypothetical protein GDO81_017815 [Engystomops pustulosus]|uniref:Uncharacterized protein n=1 Tax=Engystomops pustulosus TaxID=76066 RepID=A0AAV7ACH2_ENGPU|nr:hypothetical protein GDO81_017815 [Engystomops pustulosus]
MRPLNIFAFVLVFHIFARSESSLVKLNNGGYEDIVIAINPNVTEDLRIIEKIKAMVKEASGFLFHATGKRLFIRNAKILVPRSWSANNYIKPKIETYNTADIRIANPALKYGNDPYTQQYGRCGEPGQYIHLTPDFVTDDMFITKYGPRGRVFVHEWAHLRWGVYDEYSLDIPYYISQSGTVEATRIQKCQGTSCIVSNCIIDPTTNLYEKGCVFVPDQWTPATTSLMYMQALPPSNRIGRLYQAAEVFLMQVIEIESYVGIVTFSSSASTKSQLLQINGDAQREQLKRLLPTVASGGTNICSGIIAGIQVNKGKSGSSDGTEVLLLSDGEDNYDTNLCVPQILASGAIIHVIFLGAAEEPKLKEIAKLTGGKTVLSTDRVDAQGLIDAFSSISASDGDISKLSIQLESTAASLPPSQCLNGTVFIDNTVGNETFFLVTWQTAVPNINLQNPKGIVYTSAQFITDNIAKSSRLAIPGTAERGPWTYSICNTRTSVEALGLVVNSKASATNISPITVSAHMNQDANQYPNPMVIYATVSQGLTPVTGAKVIAMIEPVTGPIVTLELKDNGAGPDIIKNDGTYSSYFTQFSVNGRYGLKVRVVNNTNTVSRLVLPKNRALYVPGLIINGSVIMNPPRPEIPDEDLNVGEFSRTASGGSFVVSNVPSGPQPDIYKPEKITDLQAEIVDDMITLSWTATGDDLDQGKASGYELRMNINPADLRNNFDGSTTINISALTPLPAGSSETFSFVPENIVLQNGTNIYFGLVAIDKVSQRSDLSKEEK